MRRQSSHYISGWKTADDWKATKHNLLNNTDPEMWRSAFDEFCQVRLKLRYFGPIEILQEHGTFQGEGFLITAIQCSLIEFLESTIQGVTYRHLKRGETLQPYEYSSSSQIFMSFLTKRDPFRAVFSDAVASDFYSNVRCGLLHEARTKNGWLIWAINPTGAIIDPSKKILFRDNMQNALIQFISNYGAELQCNVEYQAAFIRKFDSLCE